MLTHLNKDPIKPKRVVIMGANGFVGAALKRKLQAENIEYLALTRKEVDLLEVDAAKKLTNYLQPGDSFVAVSAIAPVKDSQMLKENITMIDNLAAAISNVKLEHVVNVGSDAIYADSASPLSEDSCASPNSLHGLMHLARDVMIRDAAGDIPYATLRPTLIYGNDDPHNGYGPNRFRRLAVAGEEIKLFGNGEERRDHVWIDDVAELLKRMLFSKSAGVLNAATGQVMSFKDIAEATVKNSKKDSPIVSTPRVGEMPHNGYRPFDPKATHYAFPDFTYTSIDEGIIKVMNVE